MGWGGAKEALLLLFIHFAHRSSSVLSLTTSNSVSTDTSRRIAKIRDEICLKGKIISFSNAYK